MVLMAMIVPRLSPCFAVSDWRVPLTWGHVGAAELDVTVVVGDAVRGLEVEALEDVKGVADADDDALGDGEVNGISMEKDALDDAESMGDNVPDAVGTESVDAVAPGRVVDPEGEAVVTPPETMVLTAPGIDATLEEGEGEAVTEGTAAVSDVGEGVKVSERDTDAVLLVLVWVVGVGAGLLLPPKTQPEPNGIDGP